MIKSREDYKKYIKIEEEKYKEDYPEFTNELKKIVKIQKLYRKLEYYNNCKKSIIGRIIKSCIQIIYDRISLKYGLHIPINTIAEGLCIVHLGPIYINNKVRIGKDLKIHPMTTIGKNIGINQTSPKIGNGVWIGPGARLYGNIEIGDNTVIGTNSVVNKNIPKNVTVVGAPARIISNKGYKDYFNQ